MKIENTNMQLDQTTGIFQWGHMSAQPFNVLISGDICPQGHTEARVLAGESADVLANVAEMLADKHLSIVNLETPMTDVSAPIDKTGPNLMVTPRSVELLKAGGWDVACCANNHIGDQGAAGTLETLQLLTEHRIASVGAGKNLEEARKPLFIEREGKRIAVLAFAENEFGIATSSMAGANPLYPLRNIKQIRDAARQADVTIVLTHGGNEFLPIPSPRIIETYRAFVEAGADAVIGGHTHCPQGFEVWQGVPIIYSLGNFLFDFDTTGLPQGRYNWWTGLSVRIGFEHNRAARLEVIPHHFRPCGEAVLPLDDEERQLFFGFYNYISSALGDPETVKNCFDAWCLTRMKREFCYLGKPFYPVDWTDQTSYIRLLAARNIHTCEAHNEVLTNTFRILAERRELQVRAHLPFLETLMQGAIPE